MRTTYFIVQIVALLLLGVLPTRAFTLLGPMAGWQAPDLGYNIPDSASEYGGPRLRGDEYRLSTPIVTYGIDGSFMEFFGVDGARAVDEAFALFNSLTNVSAFSENLEEFPLKADGVNPTASALGMIDLKTQILSQIMATLGLTSPERCPSAVAMSTRFDIRSPTSITTLYLVVLPGMLMAQCIRT